ncbi:MAG: FliM/FliN family flagellar motor switch protein [Acidimicrobiales bacterium]
MSDEITAPETTAPETTAPETATPAGTGADGRPETLDEAIGSPGALIDEIAGDLGAAGSAPAGEPDEPITPMVLDELVENVDEPMSMRDMRMLADIDVEVTVEFGRARLELRDLLSLRRGSLVELSRGLDQPVGILANNTLVAYGEVVMVGDRFGVHVLEIVDPTDRSKPQRLDRTTPGVAVEHQWSDAAASPPADASNGAAEEPALAPAEPEAPSDRVWD